MRKSKYAGGVAVRVASSGELGSLARIGQLLNPADAIRARLPLGPSGSEAEISRHISIR